MSTEIASSLIDRLRTIPAGDGRPVQIEYLEQLPSPPPAERIKDLLDPSLAPLIDQIYDFLQAPIVEDHFGSDDQARDAWEAAVFNHFGQAGVDLILRNKLRVNTIQYAFTSMQMLCDYLEQTQPLQVLVDGVSPSLRDPNLYKGLANDQKRKLVIDLHRRAVAMLVVMTRQPQPYQLKPDPFADTLPN